MLHDLLLAELDAEASRTRATLERVPEGHNDFAPHAKSMPLGKLAPHVAQLSHFGRLVLTQPGLDFATAGLKPLDFESAAQLLRVFDQGMAATRGALLATPDRAWSEPWKLSHGATVFFEGTRFAGYRAMFVNHTVHHRAQLGVYLRLLEIPVPSIYGPSADEH